jgi:hypothetical protein
VQPRHALAIGMFLSGLATAIGGLRDFQDALTPSFVSGVLMQLGGAIVALYSPRVGQPPPAKTLPFPRLQELAEKAERRKVGKDVSR